MENNNNNIKLIITVSNNIYDDANRPIGSFKRGMPVYD